MLLDPHAGLYSPGHVEPGADDRSLHLADLRADRAEEIEWLADQLPARTGVDKDTILRVLRERDRVIAESDSQL